MREMATLTRTHNLRSTKQKKGVSKSKETPKTYPSEFRESSVELAIVSDQLIAQTAREPGVDPNTFHGWISKYSKLGHSQPVISRTDEYPLFGRIFVQRLKFLGAWNGVDGPTSDCRCKHCQKILHFWAVKQWEAIVSR